MKKIIALFTMLAFMLNMAVAQEPAKPTKKKEKAKTAVDAPKKDDKAAATKTDEKAATKTDAKTKGPVKKDGTPDKRYKENKEPKAAAGPTKKDGTPDKRYKANKEAKTVDAPKK